MSNDLHAIELRHRVEKGTKWHRLLLVATAIGATVTCYFGISDSLRGGGWGSSVIPFVAAPIIGIIFFCLWDALCSHVPLLHSPLGRAMGLALGVAVAALTIAASSWFIASAIGGEVATLKHQQVYAKEAAKQVDLALRNNKREDGLKTVALEIAAYWRAKAESEIKFGTDGKTKPGSGPQAHLLNSTAQDADTFAGRVGQKRDEADALHKQASALLAEMGKGTDQSKFIEQAAKLKELLVKLDTTSTTGEAGNLGIIDPGEHRYTIERQTKALRSKAKEIDDAHEKVVLNSYEPITHGQAVVKYAGEVTFAWVVGIGIDLAPLLVLLFLMLVHAEARQPYVKREEFAGNVTPIRAAE